MSEETTPAYQDSEVVERRFQGGPMGGSTLFVHKDSKEWHLDGDQPGYYLLREGCFLWTLNDYDYVVQPDHYNKDKNIETVEVMDRLPTHLDNAFKYLDRLDGKPGETVRRNAESARWYLLRYAFIKGWLNKKEWEIAVGRKSKQEE